MDVVLPDLLVNVNVMEIGMWIGRWWVSWQVSQGYVWEGDVVCVVEELSV